MANPTRMMNVNYINEIVKNTLTNDEIINNGLDVNGIKDKYFDSIQKSRDEINQKVDRVGQIFNEEHANDAALVNFEQNINAINIGIAGLKDQLVATPHFANQIQLDIETSADALNRIEENPTYLQAKKKKQDLENEKKKNLIDVRNALENFIRISGNIEKDKDNIDTIQNKIKEIDEFIAANNFKNNALITDLINFDNIPPAPAPVVGAPVVAPRSVRDALTNEFNKYAEFIDVKGDLILRLNGQINNLFDRNNRLINNADLAQLIGVYEIITQDDRTKVHRDTLEQLKKFRAETDNGSCLEFISKKIDLASLADGMIKIYYDGRKLTNEYKELLITYEAANAVQQQAMRAKLYDKLGELKKFNAKYQIGFNENDLDVLTIAQFNTAANHFLQAIDNKFVIGIHTRNNINNLQYLGPQPSITQKANIFKTLNLIGGNFIAPDKFWKSKGYFVDPDKKWFQFQDKNKNIIGSEVVIRTNCDDVLNRPGSKCIRIFYGENMRSCANKLMKDQDFQNQTIVESPYWAPDSWVRTSMTKDQQGKSVVAKVLSDDKTMVFLDSMPGFAVALKKVQIQDPAFPNDPTKTKEVLKPMLFFNERHQKILEGHDEVKKSKLLNQVQRVYKDFVFANVDDNDKGKVVNQMRMGDLIANAEFMSFKQTHENLSQKVSDKAGDLVYGARSFVDNMKNKITGSRSVPAP
jgi:hypothetical protein